MKIRLLGKNLQDIRPLLARFGLEETESDFDVVITHGGDGALLGAERACPGVPKLPLRDAATAPTCEEHSAVRRLEKFVSGKSLLTRLPKVVGITSTGGSVAGINDVFLHSASHTSALRYRVRIDGELYASEVVGDAVGIASVHGSGAYYRSITHSVFRVGIGLAFSNSTESVDHMVLDSASRIDIEITRGPARLAADNDPDELPVAEGESVTLSTGSDCAFVWDLADFMCHRCRLLRHPSPTAF